MYLANKYLFSIYYVPDILLGTGDDEASLLLGTINKYVTKYRLHKQKYMMVILLGRK